MTYFITAIGIVYIIFGVAYFVRPDYARAIIDYFKVDKRIYIGKAVKAALGILLIVCAQKAVIPWVPRIIGILAVIGVGITFAIGTEKVHAMMDWWKGLTDRWIRIIGAVVTLIGILLVYSA